MMEDVVATTLSYILVLVDMRPGMAWEDKVRLIREMASEQQLVALLELSSWFADEA